MRLGYAQSSCHPHLDISCLTNDTEARSRAVLGRASAHSEATLPWTWQADPNVRGAQVWRPVPRWTPAPGLAPSPTYFFSG